MLTLIALFHFKVSQPLLLAIAPPLEVKLIHQPFVSALQLGRRGRGAIAVKVIGLNQAAQGDERSVIFFGLEVLLVVVEAGALSHWVVL